MCAVPERFCDGVGPWRGAISSVKYFAFLPLSAFGSSYERPPVSLYQLSMVSSDKSPILDPFAY